MEGPEQLGERSERTNKNDPAATDVNNSQPCSIKDSDIKPCDRGVKQIDINNDCQTMRRMESQRGSCDSVVGGKVGEPARCSTMEGHKPGDLSGSRVKNTINPPTDKTTDTEFGESPESPARRSRTGEMESDIWPAGHEEQDHHLCECRAGESYEQLPDLARLGISSTMDYMAQCPYEDYGSGEFVMMSDFSAAEEAQLSLSRGDRVFILSAVTSDWWWVEHNGNCGYVPASHLHRVNDEDDAEDEDPWQDEEYYGSYKTLKLHLEMLSDQPRTQTYRNVILQNSSALKGKRILDLGCGTGIISFFCAQLAQPDVVYAVEASEIAEKTSRLVEENGFSGMVKVIHQKAEELKLPSRVDVLVSEWMGTCLVFEFMLESVLLARDLWLEKDGIMWPSAASIHMVPCSAEKEYATKVLFWNSPYGLDFKLFKSMAVKEFLSKANPDYVLNPEDCLSEPCVLLDVNLKTLKIEELERMSGPFTFHVKRDGMLHGFTTWFSVQFHNIGNQGHVELNTGPFNPLTHWKHTLFMLDEPIQIHRGDTIEGSAVFNRNPFWRRHLSVTLNWSVMGESAATAHNAGCKVFPIWK